MELIKKVPLLLQFVIIALTSVAASYVFHRTQIAYEINELSISLYFAYGLTIVFGYICFSCYRKPLALAFSLVLSAVAFSPVSSGALRLFPWLIPILAFFMGITTILAIPSSQGKGFFGYVLALILPAVLSQSRIGGTLPLVSMTQPIGYYELSFLTVIIVGGCFYLRYANLANLGRDEFLSKGGDEKEVAVVDRWCSSTILLIVATSSLVAAVSMLIVPTIANAFQAISLSAPFFVVALAMGFGMAVIVGLYVFQRHYQASQ